MNDSMQLVLVNAEYFRDYWYRFNEPKISEMETEVYRFAYTQSFAERLIIYRIEKTQSQYMLHKKEYATETGFGERPDSLTNNFSRVISQTEWNGIKKVLNDNCFWTMEPCYECYRSRHVLDGGHFYLEGNLPEDNICTNQKYHFVGTSAPDSIYYRIVDSFIALEPDPEIHK